MLFPGLPRQSHLRSAYDEEYLSNDSIRRSDSGRIPATFKVLWPLCGRVKREPGDMPGLPPQR